jgi:hypothetical protein
MTDPLSGSRSNWSRSLLGGGVGAGIGAVGRFLISVAFVYQLQNSGSSLFHKPDGVTLAAMLTTLDNWAFFLTSALVGLIIGGGGGATCRPLLGAALGGGLSGFFCFGLGVLPAHLAIELGAADHSKDETTLTIGLLAMIFVGASAGGAGAAAGKWGPVNAGLGRIRWR